MSGEKSSFEYSEWRVKFRTLGAKLIIIYRSPYSEKPPVTPCTFFNEFSYYLAPIILSPESLLLTGDFNIHVDVPSDPHVKMFFDWLSSMGLYQHVNIPTHISCHTLDLFTREHDSIITSKPIVDCFLSDHASVNCPLNTKLEVCYRKLRVD